MKLKAVRTPVLVVIVVVASLAACSGSPTAPLPSRAASTARNSPDAVTPQPSLSPTTPMTTDIDGTIVFARNGDLFTFGRAGEKQLTATDWVEKAPEWSR